MSAAFLTLLAAQAVEQPPAAPAPDYDAIVVTAPRVQLAPLLEPIAYFRRHCFEPFRLRRDPFQGVAADPDWQPLPLLLRRRLQLADAVPAFLLSDPERGHSLVLKYEQARHAGRLAERRCTLVVAGGKEQDKLKGGMVALFKGPGSVRHVGHAAGVPALKGWRQRLWTGIPQRHSTHWEAHGRHRNLEGSFVVIAEPEFYDTSDYVLGELKTSVGRTPPVTILTLSHTTRAPRPRT